MILDCFKAARGLIKIDMKNINYCLKIQEGNEKKNDF